MKFITENWKYIIIAVLVVIIFSLVQCQPEEKTVIEYKDRIITLPSVIGTLEPKDITELPSRGTDSIIYKNKIIYTTHPVDKKKIADFLKANDSLKNALYLKSIQEKENVTDFSDNNLELKVWTNVQGQLKDIRADYKILEREVVIQEKTITKTIIENDRFGWVVGAGYNHALDANKNSNFEASAGIRVGKVTILGSGNTEKQVGGKLLFEF
jgi:hypothetical protein